MMTAMCGMLTLSSCSTEEVIPFDKLRDRNEVIVTTRGDTSTPLQTRLYIFNEAGRCIQQLAPDDHELSLKVRERQVVPLKAPLS